MAAIVNTAIQYSLILLLFTFPSTVLSVQSLQLSDEEKQWLHQHNQIRIAYDKKFPPFEWQNKQGDYVGMSIDYIRLIEKKLNINFEVVEQKNWSETLQRFKAGDIDVLPAVAQNEKRQQWMLFTDSHISAAGVIISSNEYSSVKQLFGKKVAVVVDYFWDDVISEHDDELDIVRVESTEQGIELTAIGAIDAMLTDLASVSYIIQKEGISNLHVVPIPVSQKQSLDMRIAIRKDWPQLQSILQKTLKSISQKDKDAINNKWLKLQKISFWQSSQFWTMAIIFGSIIFSIILVILLWNYSLKLQVARRTDQLHKAQSQLIHAEKMESIGRLSAGVAHEVKNPLAILQMSIDYLKGEDNDDTIKTILTDMEDAVSRADGIIKGLLDFSREKELQLAAGDINEVIGHSLKLVEHELKQNNVTLTTELESGLPVLEMDRNRLQQVFINLFINSVQAMKDSKNNDRQLQVVSELTDEMETWNLDSKDLDIEPGHKMIKISLRDTGCGISDKDQKNIFEPFFTTKPVGEGTGLGLSVSKTIINLHHGTIVMRNRQDNKSGVEVLIVFTLKGKNNDKKNTGS